MRAAPPAGSVRGKSAVSGPRVSLVVFKHITVSYTHLDVYKRQIVLRTEHHIDRDIKEKIALFCNVPCENVIENIDLPTLYEIPLALEKEGLDKIVVNTLKLDCKEPDHTDWMNMICLLYTSRCV